MSGVRAMTSFMAVSYGGRVSGGVWLLVTGIWRNTESPTGCDGNIEQEPLQDGQRPAFRIVGSLTR